VKLCRFTADNREARVGLIEDGSSLLDLTSAGLKNLTALLESAEPAREVTAFTKQALPRLPLSTVRLLAPVERQEIWAAGVTYLRSKRARMEESDFSASAYDRVYEAERPELFFKALGEKVAGPDESVGIRKDAQWSVPEPELALVFNSRGGLVGYTVGNDMSSRDIEGENLLYLPQAKIYERSCALGPWVVIGSGEAEARRWTINIQIVRGGATVFAGKTTVNQIKRTFSELAAFLARSQSFPHGVVLLTGTGIVPPDDFTLRPGDMVEINIEGIGSLRNTVKFV
jgi:2-dehydro-3-deoxy-D-arabinonate dehydratase